MNLAQQCPGFIQATDSQSNARLLSEAAMAKNIIADVVVDVDPGIKRTGTPFINLRCNLRSLSIVYPACDLGVCSLP